jgi:hypothetical protein
MRVTRHTPETLDIEEGAGSMLMIGSCGAVIGGALTAIGWRNGEWLLLIVGAIFLAYGVYTLLFGRWNVHHFQRWRGSVIIESKGLLGRRKRELRLQDVADVEMEKVRSRGKPSYYIYYVTRQGERVRWADTYDGAEENTRECFNTARAWLELPPAVEPR